MAEQVFTNEDVQKYIESYEKDHKVLRRLDIDSLGKLRGLVERLKREIWRQMEELKAQVEAEKVELDKYHKIKDPLDKKFVEAKEKIAKAREERARRKAERDGAVKDPVKFAEYSEKYSRAKREVEKAKEAYEVLKTKPCPKRPATPALDKKKLLSEQMANAKKLVEYIKKYSDK